jgi:hypothetical protein
MERWRESCSQSYRAWEHFLAAYGDEELASVATAAVINDLIGQRTAPRREEAA